MCDNMMCDFTQETQFPVSGDNQYTDYVVVGLVSLYPYVCHCVQLAWVHHLLVCNDATLQINGVC